MRERFKLVVGNAVLLKIIIALIITALFLLSRLYKIETSLEFFGDIGRDHLVLYQWWLNGKIPLLGPGISYFSLHLPPTYFYLNYPVFLLSKFSPYSTLISLLVLDLGVFILGIILLKLKFQIKLTMIALLVILHPLYIIQSRLPWNPTFAVPFLIISVASLLLNMEKASTKKILLFVSANAITISLSIQTLPTIFVLFVLALLLFKEKFKLVLYQMISLTVISFPLIIFEIKHQFFFINRFIQNPITQPISDTVSPKFYTLLSLITGVNEWSTLTILSILVVAAVVVWYLIKYLKSYKRLRLEQLQLVILIISFITVTLIIYLLPFPAKDYNIFGPSVLLFFLIAFLPKKWALPATALLIILWVNISNISLYLRPGHQTIKEMEVCSKLVCHEEKSLMFISAETWHAFHSTPEYEFMFLKSGCSVKDITGQPDWAKRMAVVADNNTYQHGQTSFNELTLFGESKEVKVYQCTKNLSVHILEK